MDTGKRSDEEKRQDAGILSTVICLSLMCILPRQNPDFFNKAKAQRCHLLAFSLVYTCV